jgi:hypothetical protein
MMNSFSVTEVKRESRMAEPDKSLIVEGEASESDEVLLTFTKINFFASY